MEDQKIRDVYKRQGTYSGSANSKINIAKSVNIVGSANTVFDGLNKNYFFTISEGVTAVSYTHLVMPQTKEHVFLSKTLGINQLIVAINKIDLVDYDEAKFNELKDQITEGIEVDYIVALGNMKIMRTK